MIVLSSRLFRPAAPFAHLDLLASDGAADDPARVALPGRPRRGAHARRGSDPPSRRSQDGERVSRVTPPVIDELNLCDEMLVRIDRCARYARPQLWGEVSREEVIHAAVAGWIESAEREVNVAVWAINAAIRSDTPLHPYVQHWAEEIASRLDKLARTAGYHLHCEVSRSAVVRAALTNWLLDAELRPTGVVQALRASMETLAQPGGKRR